MNPSDLDRRDFHKLSLAAFTGVLAGTLSGCAKQPPAAVPAKAIPVGGATPAAAPAAAEIVLTEKQIEQLTDDRHACRGLNVCKGQGRSKDNDCAGQGTCASVADATCGGSNDCATLGGCGETAGFNDCKGQGSCHIPLMKEAWPKARSAFELAMKKRDKEFGAAPEPAAATEQ